MCEHRKSSQTMLNVIKSICTKNVYALLTNNDASDLIQFNANFFVFGLQNRSFDQQELKRKNIDAMK